MRQQAYAMPGRLLAVKQSFPPQNRDRKHKASHDARGGALRRQRKRKNIGRPRAAKVGAVALFTAGIIGNDYFRHAGFHSKRGAHGGDNGKQLLSI